MMTWFRLAPHTQARLTLHNLATSIQSTTDKNYQITNRPHRSWILTLDFSFHVTCVQLHLPEHLLDQLLSPQHIKDLEENQLSQGQHQ